MEQVAFLTLAGYGVVPSKIRTDSDFTEKANSRQKDCF